MFTLFGQFLRKMNRYRVSILKRSFQKTGGAEKYLWRVVEKFSSRGVDVEIWSASPIYKSMWRKRGIFHVVHAPSLGRLGKLFVFDQVIKRHLQSTNYDCILSMDKTTFHTHIRAGGGCHRSWLERRGRYLPAWRRASLWIEPYHRVVLSIERKGFTAPWVRRIIANSEMVKREIMEYYGVDEERIAVIHNGVEWEEFREPFEETLTGQEELKRQRGLDPHRFYFLFVGNGFERKGLRFAIEALKRLPEEANLLVVGGDSKESGYRGLVHRLGLQGRVMFFGSQQDVISFYQVADAFVLPTIYDPFSNATLEALAMGLFTVTTRGNGCSEVMADFAGVLVDDPADVEALANAMSKAMDFTVDRRRIRESVAHLTLDRQVSRLVDLCLEEGR